MASDVKLTHEIAQIINGVFESFMVGYRVSGDQRELPPTIILAYTNALRQALGVEVERDKERR